MKKTLKQLADELGVSKDKVKYQARKLPPAYTVKEGGVTYLTEQGEAEIRKLLGEAPAQAAPEQTTKEDPIVEVLKSTIAMMEKQLDEQAAQLRVKDTQLAAKDAQIDALTEAVKSQAQSINADRHNELAGTLQHQLTDGSAAEPRRKGLFGGLFGKKGDRP